MSGRSLFGHEWVGGGKSSLSFIGIRGHSNGQLSHTYRNRLGRTCFFSSANRRSYCPFSGKGRGVHAEYSTIAWTVRLTEPELFALAEIVRFLEACYSLLQGRTKCEASSGLD